MNDNRVGIIGGGLMGAGIATQFALAGINTVVVEADPARIARIPAIIDDILAEQIDAGAITSEKHDAVRTRITATSDLRTLASVDIVIEAIPDVLALKQDLYAQLESIVKPDAIIASNTSGIMPDALCQNMAHKGRFVIAHFWNPPHVIPLVEVVPGTATTPATVDRTVALLREIAAEPVVLKIAIPGFIGNRLQFAILREALHIVQSGAADAQTVDNVMKASLGRRYSMMGPLESADLGGLGTLLTIGSHLMPQLCTDEKPLELLREQVEQGNLGASTGNGFYRWDQDRVAAIRAKRRQYLVPGALTSASAEVGSDTVETPTTDPA